MTKSVSGSGKSTIRVACMRPMGIFSVSHVDGHFGQWRRSLQIVFPFLASPAGWPACLPAWLADSSTHGHRRTRTDGGRRRARARRRRPRLCKLGPPPPPPPPTECESAFQNVTFSFSFPLSFSSQSFLHLAEKTSTKILS